MTRTVPIPTSAQLAAAREIIARHRRLQGPGSTRGIERNRHIESNRHRIGGESRARRGMGLPTARHSGNDCRRGDRRIAEELVAYAEMGVDHVQLVLDPINAESIAALAPVLEALDD